MKRPAPAPSVAGPGTASADDSDVAAHDDRSFVAALARGLAVLQAFRPGEDLLTHAQLSARTRLPKATLNRYTHTLTRLGFLSPGPDGNGHRLDPHVLTLGFPVLARLGVRELARPLLQALAASEGISVALAMRDGTHMVFVERIRAPSYPALQQDIGTRVPIATTAQGRAFLAGLPVVERTRLIGEIRASGLAEWWPPVRHALTRELKRHEQHGYCFGGDWMAEVQGVAVPLTLPGGTVLSLGCGAARERMPEARLHALGAQLLQIVHRLSLHPDAGL